MKCFACFLILVSAIFDLSFLGLHPSMLESFFHHLSDYPNFSKGLESLTAQSSHRLNNAQKKLWQSTKVGKIKNIGKIGSIHL